jgi:hypothetical protein
MSKADHRVAALRPHKLTTAIGLWSLVQRGFRPEVGEQGGGEGH